MSDIFDPSVLQKLYIPPADSHKGQNGKLLIIGGSSLFHAASLWSLKIASRVVDMVFYASVPENNAIVQKAKEEFRDGIVVARGDIENYAAEADCILIGPGMLRSEGEIRNMKYEIRSLGDINSIEDEGEQTYYLTQYLLKKYPEKKWVVDAGALQMMEKGWLQQSNDIAITPHHQEFVRLFGEDGTEASVVANAKTYKCTILLKGQEDIVSNGDQTYRISGGNAGMTKGGTGDVLAGLIAALACKNDLFLATAAGSYINKKAAESLAERMGLSFNASDLCDEIPQTMRKLLLV